MPLTYIPSDPTFEYLKGLLSGFYLELEPDGKVVLMIKTEPALLMSIIEGCRLEIVIRNPQIEKRSCTLYIYDLSKDPFCITSGQFGAEHGIIQDLDDVIYKLVTESQEIKLVLFNDLTHPIYVCKLPVETVPEAFHKWLFNVYNWEEYQNLHKSPHGHYFPENELKGHPIKIINRDHSKQEMLQIIAPEYNDVYRQNPSSTIGSFKLSEYIGHGKHGNLQELAIVNVLSRLLVVKNDFFVSPKNADQTEFTDFIILNKNAAVLIESKYIISEKTTKKQAAVVKAIEQLNRAEDSILAQDFKLINKNLEEKLQKVCVVIKVCILNDRINLTDENSKAILERYPKIELPIFTSVTLFSNLLGHLSLKNEPLLSYNLFANFIRLYKEYLDRTEPEILYPQFNFDNLAIK